MVGFWLAQLLPSQYKWKIFPAELALRRVFIAFSVAQVLALLHYLMVATGWMDSGGFFDSVGLYHRIFWDLAFALNAVLTLLELLLLLSLVLSGVKTRWAMRA